MSYRAGTIEHMFDIQEANSGNTIGERTVDSLEQELVALEGLIGKARARQSVLLTELDRVQVATADGCRSLQEWVAGRLDVAPATAQELVGLSRTAPALVTDRLETGAMSVDRAVVTSRLAFRRRMGPSRDRTARHITPRSQGGSHHPTISPPSAGTTITSSSTATAIRSTPTHHPAGAASSTRPPPPPAPAHPDQAAPPRPATNQPTSPNPTPTAQPATSGTSARPIPRSMQAGSPIGQANSDPAGSDRVRPCCTRPGRSRDCSTRPDSWRGIAGGNPLRSRTRAPAGSRS